MKKFITILAALTLICSAADAQSMIDRLGRRAKYAAESALGNKIERAVYDAVDDATTPKEKTEKQKAEKPEKQDKKSKKNKAEANEDEDEGDEVKAPKSVSNAGWTCPDCGTTGITGKFCPECGAKKPADAVETWTCAQCGHEGNTGNFCDECGAKKGSKKISSTYVKSDFVPGDEVIFEDTFEGEQLGEFPSKWDLIRGVCEVVKWDGRTTFDFQDVGTIVAPLMKDMHHYLTDQFTIETDFFAGDGSEISNGMLSRSQYKLHFYNEEDGQVCELTWHTADYKEVSCYYTTTSGNGTNSEAQVGNYLVDGTWNHLSISFNKRAFKVYVNGTRVINIPNMKAPERLELESKLWGDHGVNFISNFRICKGAVPLYDRLTTDGKIVSYGITFESGKADLKPESMSEIARIAKLMQDDASLKFEVQGHCDNTGKDSVNDPLSQKRAEAIVAALVEQGIAANRLTAVGKGSHNPIADNSTDEGRAKNRRVEFIKK